MKKWILAACLSASLPMAAQTDTIIITTNYGDMKAVFYEDSPNHRALYTRRMNDGAFDGTLFYRVVADFMIQGGSPDSRNARPGERVGSGSTQYLLMPEARETHLPIKGAIAAPRQPDALNPAKKSDASQFFIVQGKRYTEGYLDTLEMARNNPIKNAWWKENYMPHKAEMDSLKAIDKKEYARRYKAYRAQLDEYLHAHPDCLFFTPEERQHLCQEGGELKLRGEYTIFAQVVEGLEVIDRIAGLQTDRHERPLQDAVIQRIRVK